MASQTVCSANAVGTAQRKRSSAASSHGIQKSRDRTSHNLRNKLSLAFPDCRTSRRLRTFLPSSIALFNSLPPHVSSSPSKSLFLQNLDKHFESDRFSLCLPEYSFMYSAFLSLSLSDSIIIFYLFFYFCSCVWFASRQGEPLN